MRDSEVMPSVYSSLEKRYCFMPVSMLMIRGMGRSSACTVDGWKELVGTYRGERVESTTLASE
jgi:hypothetical protein